MTERHIRIFALALVAAASVHAASDPTLEDIAAAHGELEGLRDYAVRMERTELPALTASARPQPAGWRCLRLSLARDQLAYLERDPGAPDAAILHRSGAGGGWRADLDRGWLLTVTPAGHAVAVRETLPLAPVLLVRDLLSGTGAVSGPLPDEEPLVRYVYRVADGATLLLWFDSRTRLLRRLQQNGLSVSYDEYENVQGFPVSRRMTVTSREGTVLRVRITGVSFDAPFPDDLAVPAGVGPPAVGDGAANSGIGSAQGTGPAHRNRLASMLCPS